MLNLRAANYRAEINYAYPKNPTLLEGCNMKRAYLFLVTVFTIAVFLPSGFAQTLSITDGTNSFSVPAGPGGLASQTLPGPNTGDILFDEIWFLNVGGLATRLDNTPAANIAVSGNNTSSGTISYSSVPNSATAALLDIELTYQIGSPTSGDLEIDLELSLPASATSSVTGSLVNYFDYDLNGAGSQTAVFTNTPFPTITQTNTLTGETYSRAGIGASAFDIASFNGLENDLITGLLLDSTPDLGVIDVTAAFQWDFTLAPGESFSIEAGGFSAVGVAVPEPSTLAMMSFLGVVVSLRRSRKRS